MTSIRIFQNEFDQSTDNTFDFSDLKFQEVNRYGYINDDGDLVVLRGTDFVYDGDYLRSGTVTQFTVYDDDTTAVPVLRGRDFAVSAQVLLGQDREGPDDIDATWRAILEGETTVRGPGGAFEVFSQWGNDGYRAPLGIVRGNDSTVRDVNVYDEFAGGFNEVGAGTAFYGGDMDFYGSGYWVVGDVTNLDEQAFAQGGNDRIVAASEFFYASTTYHEGDFGYHDGFGVGGDDLLDLRGNTGDTNKYLNGDSYSVSETGTLIGGDDVIRAGNFGTYRIAGDTYRAAAEAVVIGGNDRIYGGRSDDDIYGDTQNEQAGVTGGDDYLHSGMAGDDGLYGGGGDDTLVAGGDFVSASGGSGDDMIMVVRDGEMTAYGGDDTDTVDYSASDRRVWIDLNDQNNHRGWASDDYFEDIESYKGTDFGDTIKGDSSDDRYSGGKGNDTLYAGSGTNELFGNGGNDLLVSGSGADFFNGGGGRDQVSYANSNNAVEVNLNQGFGSGNTASGDTYKNIEDATGSGGDDTLRGTGDSNRFRGGDGDDRLYGKDGNDRLYGNRGEDRLVAGDGDDRLYGGSNADILLGERGDDRYVGGGGADVFIIARGDGDDRILDFENNVDTIRFTGFAGGFDPFDDAETIDGDAHFDLGNGNTLIVEGISVGNLENDVDIA